jgi:pantoate--beta-alanine ligase
MRIYHRKDDLQKEMAFLKKEGKSIGFVPTMGALHEGHLTLVRQCVSENDICVVSIFVNPTQFNNKEDLEKYPRMLEVDAALLKENGCGFIFAPDEKEIYPEPDLRIFDFGILDKVMEGRFRPGHFNGVAQVVSKLFDMVQPDKAYFGEKDFQQLVIIRELVRQYNIPVKIIGCPIVREPDGMALSSRNMRLSPEEREKAVLISDTLLKSRNFIGQKNIADVKKWVVDRINSEPLLEVEYFDIVDVSSLQSVENWPEGSVVIGCIAVYCGEIRLIDNIQYYKEFTA